MPDRLIGTTLDIEAMNAPGETAGSPQRMGFQDLLFRRLSQNVKNERRGDTRLSDAERKLAGDARYFTVS